MNPGAAWHGGGSAGPRRFEAAGKPGRAFWIGAMGLGAALLVGLGVLSMVLPKQVMNAVMPVFMIVFLGGYLVFFVFGLRGKKVLLDVHGDRVVLDEGRGGEFPFSGAALSLWHMASVGVDMGTVLHLSGGGRRLLIGGRDHRPGAGLTMSAPPVDSVDVFLPADAFDALLACVSSATVAPRAASGPWRCALLPSTISPRNLLATMAPWLGSVVLTGVVSMALAALGGLDSGLGRMIALPLLGVILVAGLVLTVTRSMRKGPALEIEVDPRELRLRDPGTGRVLAAAPPSAIATARGVYRVYSRGAVFDYATLALRIPGHEDVILYVQDTRFGWGDAVQRGSAPAYVVGPPDWITLVEMFGARPFLVVRGS
ncbi:hypothetical protein [Chondromyces crocatus]|uniref:Uncharacterized protein n=1 Tax=Chondromyces crocatus TaxID=52 RepID=A0A0K1EKW5_CHOCO|nr:hypothetical protein [Chondromyces crocatus]AKT41263.1 uncharacterized protein CMC5_054300 [Chondromyces crocatus]